METATALEDERWNPSGTGWALPEETLVATVRSMVICALAGAGRLPSPERDARIGRYEAMLVGLTYSYATGVYGSVEVERLVAENAALRSLLSPNPPDAGELRRFRRAHRAELVECVATTLRRFLDLGLGGPPVRVRPSGARPDQGAEEASEMELRRWSQVEGLSRVQRAVRVDSSLLDV